MAGPWEKYTPAQKPPGTGGPWAKFAGATYIPPEPEGTSDPEKKYLGDYQNAQDDADNADGLIDKAKAGLKVWQMDNRMEAPGPGGVPYATPGDVPLGAQDPNAMTAGDAVMGLSLPAAPVAESVNAVSNAGQALTRAPTAGPGPEVMEGLRESLKGKELIPEAVKEAIKGSRLRRGAAAGGAASTALGSYEVLKHNPAIAAALGGAGAAVSPVGSGVLENIIANKIMESRRKAKQ